MYHVVFSNKAEKQLKKLDRLEAALVLGWIKKNLEGSDSPRRSGKALVGDMAGYWRYRVGDYRIIAEIQDAQVVILIVNVHHRRDIYEKFKKL